MYMINYYIASDYQKIVRDIIFYMYLISVHFETCALAGPNAELFMQGISITRALSIHGLGLYIESLGLFQLVSGDARGFTDETE